ncbi:MAG: hypothetical protein QGF71_04900, partial [Rhodospirillales bacterium]|nr:hypothetical protein [Rhodospirillales bacterium]
GKIIKNVVRVRTIWINRLYQESQIESRYKILFENANDCIFITTPDSFQHVDVNGTAVKLLDYGKEELLAMGLADMDGSGDRSHVIAALGQKGK